MLNRNLGVFKYPFGVFERNGKIMFGYCNTMRVCVDRWVVGVSEGESDPRNGMCWLGSQSQRGVRSFKQSLIQDWRLCKRRCAKRNKTWLFSCSNGARREQKNMWDRQGSQGTIISAKKVWQHFSDAVSHLIKTLSSSLTPSNPKLHCVWTKEMMEQPAFETNHSKKPPQYPQVKSRRVKWFSVGGGRLVQNQQNIFLTQMFIVVFLIFETGSFSLTMITEVWGKQAAFMLVMAQ